MDRDYLIIVSGLPRSGTSLIMQMLYAGGIPLLYDTNRPADIHNPLGYFEYQPIYNIENFSDISWLQQYKGHAVKIISPILAKLTISFPAKVIFVKRPLNEVILSQRKVAMDRGNTLAIDDNQLITIFNKHINYLLNILEQNIYTYVLEIEFPEIFSDIDYVIQSLNKFLDGNLDVRKMRNVIHPELYRNKTASL